MTIKFVFLFIPVQNTPLICRSVNLPVSDSFWLCVYNPNSAASFLVDLKTKNLSSGTHIVLVRTLYLLEN